MKQDGYRVPRGVFGKALLHAAARDKRFHKGLKEGKWIVEPALLPTTGESVPQDEDEFA
jgi:hypothetical protein